MSYSLSMSSSSCWLADRWIQHCLTAPSMCSGHPTGMWESSRSPSPFCSMIVNSIGTSIVAFRLTCARLHFHVSGASKPRAASNSSDGNSGWSFIGSTSSLMTNFSPCSGWGCCHWGSWLGWGVVSLGAAMSSNQVGRTDWTPIALAELAFLMLSLRRLWYTGGIIHAGTNTVINCTFQMTCRFCGLISGVMHLTWPSITLVYDSERSNDAVTFKPRYSSLNQYSLSNIKERWGALTSNTYVAGIRKVTNHSAKNSIILTSSFGRIVWTAWSAASMSGTCVGEGSPTVRLAYSSAKWSLHNLETHWLGFSISIVILARAMGLEAWTGNAVILKLVLGI